MHILHKRSDPRSLHIIALSQQIVSESYRGSGLNVNGLRLTIGKHYTSYAL